MFLPVSALLSSLEYRALSCADVDVCGVEFSSGNVHGPVLFFCIPGAKVDGHDFAADAVSRGAAALVVSRPLDLPVPQFLLDDPRLALALASSRFYGEPSRSLDLMGVTGTNGKTTTSFLVEWICRFAGRKTGLLGTVEWRVGDQLLPSLNTTPESAKLQGMLAQMRDNGVSSVSMEISSHAIDLHRIDGCSFKVLAFSNLSQDHLDYHHDMLSYAQVKARLFSDYPCESYAICIDDELGRQIAASLRQRGAKLLTVGMDSAADLHPLNMHFGDKGIDLELSVLSQRKSLSLPLVGSFNVQNALLALGMAMQAGIDCDSALLALAQAPQVPGRLQRVKGSVDTGISVFVDYAHTPDAVQKAVAVLKEIAPARLIVVFGCGGDRDKGKRPLMGAAALQADIAVVTSDNPRSEDPDAIIADILAGMEKGRDRTIVQADRRLAIRQALQLARSGDFVLIAGKGHEDYQIIAGQKHSFDDRLVAAEELDRL